MRKNLKVFRVQQLMTQAEFAHKLGCSRATYSAIENGMREGRKTFWKKLQTAFDVPDENMWALQKDEN